LLDIVQKFREYLLSKDFVGIHTPKLNSGARRRGSCIQSTIQWPACRFDTISSVTQPNCYFEV